MTGQLLLPAVVLLGMAVAVGARWPRLWLGLTLGGTVAALGAALTVFLTGADWDWQSQFLLGGEVVHLRLDGLSAVFVVLAAGVGGAGAVYARGYWPDHMHPASAPRGRAWWSALVLSMLWVLTASNGLHFLMAWEAFAICGYFLITLDPKKPAVRAAGWLYLAASHAGTVCLFAFFTLLAARTGGWDLGPLRADASCAPLFWLALAGFGMKAGFFPLHIWLPSAHASAPSHVSAIMSGVAIKTGSYGIMRFSGWLPMPPAAGWVVIGLGALSALLGTAFALAQNDFKRLLAYCSVENIGIILIGLGAALLGRAHDDAAWGRLALAGALLHVWNHGAFKTLLFFGAGSVLHATGTRDMSRLGGLWRLMPWTAGLFALGSVAVAGLPPLNGFVSELLIYLGLFDAVAGKQASAWAALPAAILLAMSGALALAAFAKAGAMIFLGAARTQPAATAHECGGWMRGPMLALAGVCLALGLAPVLLWPALSSAVAAWHPAWAGAAAHTMASAECLASDSGQHARTTVARAGCPPPFIPSPELSVSADAAAPLATLGRVHLGLLVLLAAAGCLLWRKVRSNNLRRGPTWDCGYAAPTARMQYSSGSFAGLAADWFWWILRPLRTLRRARGHFPARALWLERVPDTMLERVLLPAGARVMQVSTAVRRLQHGRLSAYILYVVAGLAALGILVLLESLS
ncbi:MAG: proton-conducting transporter membrane subunit [Verrucomicrobiota bacterium]